MEENNLCCLGFSHFLGIGPVRFKALLQAFGDVKQAYNASESDIKNILGIKIGERFSQFRIKFDPEKKSQEIKQKQITIITLLDPRYPQLLKEISDPPICLYIKGDINKLNLNQEFFFAIVGTRKPTSYGKQVTKKFSSQLSEAGLIIVSGMAIGVDAFAHQAAIEINNKTVAILGCGVDVIYPAINTKLYYQIIKTGGLVISEFPPGHTVLKGLFVARNRIISGLSKEVLIIEGAKESGALITARYAAEQGREVFAPPSPITSEMGTAPNLLLKQGAKLVTSVEDIFEEFSLKIKTTAKKDLTSQLETEEKRIYAILLEKPTSVDDLMIQLKLSTDQLLSLLSVMEIKGILEKNSEGNYQIK